MRLPLPLGEVQQLARFAEAIERRALVEDAGLRAVQILGAGLGIEGAAAEGYGPLPAVEDRKHDPVAEAVERRASIVGGDQKAAVDQGRRPRPLGDQIVLQPRPTAGGVADPEPRPLRLRQAAPL